MIINNLRELREIGRLSNGDRINFGHITMTVCHNHFYNYGSSCHTDMVESLFGSVERWSFCSDAYGYTSTEGIFPNYRDGDFGAAYRVAEKIYVEILGQEAPDECASLMSSVKRAEEVTGTRLISDYSTLSGSNTCSAAFQSSSPSICALISQETLDECCTSEKKRRTRFKIQDFLNDRNRK